jgi:hypothetical protein
LTTEAQARENRRNQAERETLLEKNAPSWVNSLCFAEQFRHIQFKMGLRQRVHKNKLELLLKTLCDENLCRC